MDTRTSGTMKEKWKHVNTTYKQLTRPASRHPKSLTPSRSLSDVRDAIRMRMQAKETRRKKKEPRQNKRQASTMRAHTYKVNTMA
jgi:hypothetical protein